MNSNLSLANERMKRGLLALAALAAVGLAAFLRLKLARFAHFPGHGDYAFYYRVAVNLAQGRGLQVDYIWHYLNGLPSLPHYSSDFWMPLTSILVSLPMFVAGTSLFVALLMPIAAGLGLAALTCLLGKVYSGNSMVALTAGGVVLFAPLLFKYSLLTDSVIFYTLFVTAALAAMLVGRGEWRAFLLAAALCGLAHLTRQDGVLFFGTLTAVILLSPQGWKTKGVCLSLSAGIYLLVLSPLLAINFHEFDAPLPPGPSKSMFLTTYEDFYAYGKALTLQNYLAQGIAAIVRFKWETALYNLRVIAASLGWPLTLLALLGVLFPVRPPVPCGGADAPGHSRQPLLIGLAFVYLFYTLVASYSSYGTGFRRSLMGLFPFIVVVAVDWAYRRLRWKGLVAGGFVLLTVVYAWQGYASTRALLAEHNRLGEELSPLGEMLRQDAVATGLPQQSLVLMARDVWEVYEAVRAQVVEIPNNDLETILAIARHYHVTHVLLPARRAALDAVYDGCQNDERLVFVAQLPGSDLKLYRLEQP